MCTQLRLGLYVRKTQVKSVKLVSDGTSRPLLVTSLMASLFYPFFRYYRNLTDNNRVGISKQLTTTFSFVYIY